MVMIEMSQHVGINYNFVLFASNEYTTCTVSGFSLFEIIAERCTWLLLPYSLTIHVQSIFIISNSKGLTEILRDIPTWTFQS